VIYRFFSFYNAYNAIKEIRVNGFENLLDNLEYSFCIDSHVIRDTDADWEKGWMRMIWIHVYVSNIVSFLGCFLTASELSI
jgi:hypothetical protein